MSPAPMFKKWRVGPVDDGPTRKPGPHSQPPMRQNTPVQRLNTKRDAIHDESLFRDPEEPVYLLSLGKEIEESQPFFVAHAHTST